MKTHLLSLLCLATWVVMSPLVSKAQQSYQDSPGYFELGEMEKLFQEESTLEVNISGALLRMVAEASRFEDDALADMLYKLKAIRVLGYSLDDRPDGLYERIGEVSNRLRDQGWERIVRVVEDGERVEVMVQATEDRIDGMLVFVVAPGENETVFVNIVGEIRPEEIGRIGRRFRIEAIEDL